jgi:thiol-disulfide isomerase/thioredoxin
VRSLFGVGLVILSLALAGCSVVGKKTNTADASSRNGSSGAGTARTDIPVADTTAPPPGSNGLLAGQVSDSFNRRPGGVLIQVVDLQDAKSAAARIEVEADKDGYFTIQGLQPGKHYQLIARVKDGERVLSGTKVAMPPNPHLSIVMNEDFTSPTTPPLPKVTPVPDKPKSGAKSTGPAATIQPPRPEDEAPKPPAASSANVSDPSKIADKGWAPPPTVNIKSVPPPGPSSSPHSLEEDPLLPKVNPGTGAAPSEPSPSFVPTALTPVPSCVLIGDRLDNFALYDLDAYPWEYKRDRHGRLMLLQFWHSACGPCLNSVPVLAKWQKDYGPLGLEVVGIAYEQGERDKQVEIVRSIRGRYSINYTTLLGAGDRCPVAQQFKIGSHPTLVLIDENGRIVWRGEGYDAAKFKELEFEIRKRLEHRR